MHSVERSVVACTDGSLAAGSAVERAGAIAESFDAEVVVTHVRSPVVRLLATPPADAFGRVRLDATLDEIWAEPARAAGVPVRTEIRDGRPVDELLAVAASEGAICIVAGMCGRDASAGAVIGRTAEALLRQSSCPVVLVAPPEPARMTALSSVVNARVRPGGAQ